MLSAYTVHIAKEVSFSSPPIAMCKQNARQSSPTGNNAEQLNSSRKLLFLLVTVVYVRMVQNNALALEVLRTTTVVTAFTASEGVSQKRSGCEESYKRSSMQPWRKQIVKQTLSLKTLDQYIQLNCN